MRRAILVGAGGMGRAWARNLRDGGVEVVAWVDVRPGVAQSASEELGYAVSETDLSLEEALRLTGIDFVVDVTAPEAHVNVTLTSLAAGIPVLGEKPMATSMEDGRRMVEAADAAKRLYMVSQSRRYDPNITAFRALVERIGPPAILNADFFKGPHFGGFRDEMESPLILDMAIHTFDQARYITGLDPVSVYAEEFNPPWSWYKGNSSANALFEMSGGLRFAYRGSWCTSGLDTSWQAEWRAAGPRGSAAWDGDNAPTAEVLNESGELTKVGSEPEAVDAGIRGSLAEFLQALDSGETPSGECHDNIKSMAMVFAAAESSRTGLRVKIDADS